MDNREIIKAVKAWQSNAMFHPLTCANVSSHKPLIPCEYKGDVILLCPDCAYQQEHIPNIVLQVYEDSKNEDGTN